MDLVVWNKADWLIDWLKRTTQSRVRWWACRHVLQDGVLCGVSSPLPSLCSSTCYRQHTLVVYLQHSNSILACTLYIVQKKKHTHTHTEYSSFTNLTADCLADQHKQLHQSPTYSYSLHWQRCNIMGRYLCTVIHCTNSGATLPLHDHKWAVVVAVAKFIVFQHRLQDERNRCGCSDVIPRS